jgi:hypothetical protein
MAHHEHDHDHEHDHEDELEDELDELDEQELAEKREHALRRQVALSQVRQYGDAVLRMRANEVEPLDEELARLAERMVGLCTHDGRSGSRHRRSGSLRGSSSSTTTARTGDREPCRTAETSQTAEAALSPACAAPVERPTEVTIAAADGPGRC